MILILILNRILILIKTLWNDTKFSGYLIYKAQLFVIEFHGEILILIIILILKKKF